MEMILLDSELEQEGFQVIIRKFVMKIEIVLFDLILN